MATRTRLACAGLICISALLGSCSSRMGHEAELGSLHRQLGELPPEAMELPIDREGAIEVARELGLEEGLAPWLLHLRSDGHRGWQWVVSNVTSDDGSGQKGGRALFIDATTGELVNEGWWEGMP